MPVAERKDPYRNFRYLVEIDGIAQTGFAEVILPASSSRIIEYRQGNEPPYVRKIPGLIKYGNLILSCGITDSMDLYNWWKLVEEGKSKEARRNIAVILMDEEGNPAARWQFINAWPCRYDPPDLDAEGNDAAIETFEITFETMERVE